MSVRSITNGELTLNNLNVSTINGSAYPPSSSVIYGTGGGTFILGASSSQVVDTITLPIGVWSIQMAENVDLGGGVINEISGVLYVLSLIAPTTYYYSQVLVQYQDLTSFPNVEYSFTNNFIINVTTTTTFIFAINSNFQSPASASVSTPNIFISPPPSQTFLFATKLA